MKALLLAVLACYLIASAQAHADSPRLVRPTVAANATMPRQPVRSSNIASVGYDASKQILEVEFTTGAVYQYYGVPELVYKGLMQAPSHGSYFARYVKAVGYRYKEID